MKMTERDELIKDLEGKVAYWYQECQYPSAPSFAELIADDIITDRQAILDKVCEPLRRYKYEALKGNSVLVSKGLCDCIDESLNLAEEMKGKV